MLKPETEFSINHLCDALRNGFELTIRRDRQMPLDDISTTWSELIAHTLRDVDPRIPLRRPRKRDARWSAARRALPGLVQHRGSEGGFGVPLLMRKIPAAGRMPLAIWDELQEAARMLNVATPAGRLMLFGDGADFDWGT